MNPCLSLCLEGEWAVSDRLVAQRLNHYATPGPLSCYTVRSEIQCALRLRYVDLAVSIEVAVEVCCCCVTFRCIQLLNSG